MFVHTAWETLRDEKSRKKYDREYAAGRRTRDQWEEDEARPL